MKLERSEKMKVKIKAETKAENSGQYIDSSEEKDHYFKNIRT